MSNGIMVRGALASRSWIRRTACLIPHLPFRKIRNYCITNGRSAQSPIPNGPRRGHLSIAADSAAPNGPRRGHLISAPILSSLTVPAAYRPLCRCKSHKMPSCATLVVCLTGDGRTVYSRFSLLFRPQMQNPSAIGWKLPAPESRYCGFAPAAFRKKRGPSLG